MTERDGNNSDEGTVTAADVLAGERHGVADFAEARSGGAIVNFDPSEINDAHAVVLVGGSGAVLQETWKLDEAGEVPLQDRVRLLSQKAFELWFKNVKYYHEKSDKTVTAAALWLAHPGRRQYAGMVFDPVSTPPGYYNLFQGFAYEWALDAVGSPPPVPDGTEGDREDWVGENEGVYPGLGSCALFLDHVRANICDGDDVLYEKVIAWAAHIFQKPAERIGVALALRGGKGTGKTVFGEVLGELLRIYWLIVDHPRYVTGQFNAHMEKLLLLQADEAFWAGSKEGEGALKGLITSREHLIERKNVDPYRVANYVRILVTSNEDWVVPASFDERRWMVLDVADHAKQNRAYFAAMFRQLEAPVPEVSAGPQGDGVEHAGRPGGGYAALFRYLMDYDLSTVDINAIPQTRGLLEQKLRSLSPHQEWWHECLWQGWLVVTTSGDKVWPGEVELDVLFKAYADWFQRNIRRGHQLKKAQFVKEIVRKFVPGAVRFRGNDGLGNRPWMYRLDTLEACREVFDDWIGGGVGWLGPDGKLDAGGRGDNLMQPGEEI
jgi:hypothetical protein